MRSLSSCDVRHEAGVQSLEDEGIVERVCSWCQMMGMVMAGRVECAAFGDTIKSL